MPSPSLNTIYDAVIIGAGLSGLQAAVLLHAAGLNICVLEATAHIGGKIRSVQSSERGFNDLGATWINDTNQEEMFKLVQKYGIETEIQRADGDSIHQGPGVDGDASGDQEVLQQLLETVRRESAQCNLEDPEASPKASELGRMTFRDFCTGISQSETAIAFADGVTAGLLGVQGDEISALYLLHYIKAGSGIDNLISDQKHGGQYLRARPGMQTIPKHLAAELPSDSIFLEAPVTSIRQWPESDTPCEVHTSSGQVFTSQRVVLSIPTPLHKTISFDPPLPKPRQILQDTTVSGYYSKIVFVFSSPWWRDAGLSGVLDSWTGPISFSRDTSVPDDDLWSISCFIIGIRGREWSKYTRSERYEQAWSQFKACFGPFVESIPEPARSFQMEWSKEPFHLGAPCPIIPGGNDVMVEAAGELDKPFGKVHFVGTETAHVWRGYMEGAVRSGQRGAAEVLGALRKDN
ncbi:amine oxidase [Aspergillus granulosus]|uniref:Amine oxidase n=1 Tax=Aspergillus granulosus TaxID=176169 RepID=A0ABR4I5I6_9EURO